MIPMTSEPERWVRSGHPSRMIVTLHTDHLTSLEQIERFLDGTDEIVFHAPDGAARRAWIAGCCASSAMRRRHRRERGLLLRFLIKVTGYSASADEAPDRPVPRRAPPARPPRAAGQALRLPLRPGRSAGAGRTRCLHGQLSGPATRKLAERACHLFGDARYAAPGRRSRWRTCTTCAAPRATSAPAAPCRQDPADQHAIGERRAPQPDGRPGFIRIDSVHQGDLDGIKGVYHINAVDCAHPVPAGRHRRAHQRALPAARPRGPAGAASPSRSCGFHADNGSEYINHRVAELLDKLNIEFTKSRPRHSNDNALAETKNGAVVRKHFGYAHIPSRFAAQVNAFYPDVLNPYVNFHRPCFFPRTTIDAKGTPAPTLPLRGHDDPVRQTRQPAQRRRPPQTRHHPGPATPPGTAVSDSAAARHLNAARTALFEQIFKPRKSA